MSFEPRHISVEKRPFSLNSRDEPYVPKVTQQAMLSGAKSDELVDMLIVTGKSKAHTYLPTRDHSSPIIENR